PPNDIRQGELFIASVYEALRKSPKWDRTLLLVFYDEHGGLYDHVAPPKAAFDERAADGFDQLGFRIPGIAAGGLVRRGETIHTLIEHSSVPGLLSRIFELPFLNKRAELAGDLGTALSLDLRRDALRPVAPAMPAIEALFQDLDQAHMRPFGQAELLDFAVQRGLTTRDGWRPALRKLHRDMADIYEKLGIVKWG
ncbi:MAG: hypothetical protein IV100_01245, partial [Myxococcales bacterium]|nr:hypothetical protein [Myxococcales bacterium]